jgi:hypothetical protein
MSNQETEPPRLKGQRPHAVVDRPYALLPTSTQGWAPQAEIRNFIDVPFSGFLGPPSEREDRLEYCTIHIYLSLLYHIYSILLKSIPINGLDWQLNTQFAEDNLNEDLAFLMLQSLLKDDSEAFLLPLQGLREQDTCF